MYFLAVAFFQKPKYADFMSGLSLVGCARCVFWPYSCFVWTLASFSCFAWLASCLVFWCWLLPRSFFFVFFAWVGKFLPSCGRTWHV